MSYLLLSFVMSTTYAQCGLNRDPTCHSINLTRHPNEFSSSATIQISSANQFDTIHRVYFDINEYECLNPTLTIYSQEINPFTIEYMHNYATYTIQCISNKYECSYVSCVSNHALLVEDISPNTIYPMIMNISSANNECNGVYTNTNITLLCSNTELHSSDWSHDTTNTLKLWFHEVTKYVSYGDRWIYLSIIGAILLCICCCCCVALIRQCRQQKNVKMHPKPKFAKVKVKKAKKAPEYAGDEQECIPMVVKNKKGTIYLQTSYFNDRQLKNIQKAFGDNLREAPKILFGDNYADKHRPKHVKHRNKSAGQSKVIGKYDRKYGFGIPTTFDDAKEYGFKFSDKNFSKMVENEFKILQKHLLRGGDVIIPSPMKKDLRDRPQKYFRDGNHNSNQLIFHNLGTGISSLAFQNLLVIQKNIEKLKKYAFAVAKVKQKLYDQPYYSEDELDSDRIIEESLSVTETEENPLISTGKTNQNSCTQGEINDFVRGSLIFQTAWYNQKQMQHIKKQCKSKSDIKKVGKMLFGDNDTDRFRGKGVKRLHFGGQASVMGHFDRLFAYGIVTTFVHTDTDNDLPEIGSFMYKMDQQFQPLQQHLLNGYDVIVPKPRKQDIVANKKNYFKNGKQMVFHNIGTGIASLPFKYVAYIQRKIDELKKYARTTRTMKYYIYSGNNIGITVQNNVGITGRDIYHCPICSREQHYLINLKKCTHSICEECLCDYICRHLVYENNPMDQRFRCWASDIGKCNGRICLDDIRYCDDRCRCEKCAQNNSDTGTDTILDVERYEQFVNIMKTFDIKCKWDKTDCPNCFKPFPVSKPWQQNIIDETDEGTGYDIVKLDIFCKNTNCCNCCGDKVKTAEDDMKYQFSDDEKDVYNGFNNCAVCNYYYCDQCRRNCFYEIEQKVTMRRPLPIENAMIDFHIQQQTSNFCLNEQSFECCEICWFTYYCRKCPHCEYVHCAHCNEEWEGCTQNWSDKLDENMFIDDEYKLENHSNKKKHFCAKTKSKMADLISKKREKREKSKDTVLRTFAKEKEESEYKFRQQQILYQKQLKQMEKLQKENALWKSKVLESENIQLTKENTEQEIYLKQTRFEKEQFRVKAENVEKKAMEFEKENKELRKKVGYIMTWQWHDCGSIWKSYDYNINKAIETLKINGSYTYLCAANEQNYKITKTSKDRGSQINTKTKVQRNMRRQKIERGLNVIQYPKWWNMSDLQLESEPGASVNATYAKPKLIEMDLNTFPAKDVVNQFYKTAKGYTIIKIESVQNQMLYDAYYGVRSKLLRLVGNGKLNERSLFHGTKIESVMGLIGKEGFRKEFNTTAAYGKGTYFARDASYSISYSSNNNGIYKMFQCKVLCAESCLGDGSYELNKWPKKQNGSGLIYDSLVDNIGNPSIFVIHDDVRAYPLFVIHFKRV